MTGHRDKYAKQVNFSTRAPSPTHPPTYAHLHTYTHTHKKNNTKTHKHTDTHIHKHTNITYLIADRKATMINPHRREHRERLRRLLRPESGSATPPSPFPRRKPPTHTAPAPAPAAAAAGHPRGRSCPAHSPDARPPVHMQLVAEHTARQFSE